MGLTRLAGVRVPSTSKRQIVFLTGRSLSAGTMLAAAAVVAVMVSSVVLLLSMVLQSSYILSARQALLVTSGREWSDSNGFEWLVLNPVMSLTG